MEEKLYTPEQVAKILQIHKYTVLKFIKQGKLRASKLGRVYRIRESDLEGFLEESANGKKTSQDTIDKNQVTERKNKKQKQTSLSSHSENDDATTESGEKLTKVDTIEYNSEENKEAGEDKYYILE